MDNLPVGSVLIWPGNANSLPSNWRVCDGSRLRKSVFSDLYTVLNENWYIPSPSTSADFFNIPDLRGMFLRGVNGVRADEYRDPDINLRKVAVKGLDENSQGSLQKFQIQRHSHSLRAGVGSSGPRSALSQDTNNEYDYPMGEVGGNETRPTNAYVYYIIKISADLVTKLVADKDILPPPESPPTPTPKSEDKPKPKLPKKPKDTIDP